MNVKSLEDSTFPDMKNTLAKNIPLIIANDGKLNDSEKVNDSFASIEESTKPV